METIIVFQLDLGLLRDPSSKFDEDNIRVMHDGSSKDAI
jgi:hypothetical protein